MRAYLRMSALAALAILVARPGAAQTAPDARDWSVDRSHSRVGFSIRHFFTPVEGSFSDYEIDLAFDPAAPDEARVNVRIDAASVDTDNDRRDADLRSENFFDVERFPGLTFESTAVRPTSDSTFVVEGDLTIRDVTKPVALTVTLLGLREFDPPDAGNGRALAGFRAEATIDRRDFGVGAGRWAETVVLGAEVTVTVLLEANLR